MEQLREPTLEQDGEEYEGKMDGYLSMKETPIINTQKRIQCQPHKLITCYEEGAEYLTRNFADVPMFMCHSCYMRYGNELLAKIEYS